ncbi:MAG TPA: hypothetical protein VLH94_02020 [Spirochaetia bacterium]|nr:hypothetical protein [Spirochaetia bacterium]
MSSKSWYLDNPTLFQQIKDDVSRNFPMMITFTVNDVVLIRGNLQLYDNTHHEIDQYTIEIELPKSYPKGIPVVREINNRIPKIPDRHVYDKGGLCLFLLEEKWKYYKEGTSIVDFINGPISLYLLGQSFFEQKGVFPQGERSHGVKGIVELYTEILQTDDTEIIKTFVEYLCEPITRGHWPCYCKSGKKIRNCHMNILAEYRNKIEPEIAMNSLTYLLREEIDSKKK